VKECYLICSHQPGYFLDLSALKNPFPIKFTPYLLSAFQDTGHFTIFACINRP
jgi:hypothetical protein